MGYKFGQDTKKIIIEIEGEEYPVKLNAQTGPKLEEFGREAVKMSKDENVTFEEIEDIILDFIENMLGVEETAEILETMPEEYKNPFEYMAIANYITEQIKEQGGNIVPAKQGANVVQVEQLRRKRR